MQQFIELILHAVLAVLGFIFGGFTERRHLRQLDARERRMAGMLVTDLKQVPQSAARQPAMMVVGQVVIASDYYKGFVAKLRSIVGGEVRVFDNMLLRARREALLRMMEEAQEAGANCVMNVRYETANIGGTGRRFAPMAEVLAYGTAVALPTPQAPSPTVDASTAVSGSSPLPPLTP